MKFYKDAFYLLKSQKIEPFLREKLQIELLIYPPDKKKRDLDNVVKACQDVLQQAGIIQNDFNIWKLTVERKEVRQYGEVQFTIREMI